MNPKLPSTGTAVLDAYLAVIFDAFRDQPWVVAEAYAARVWADCRWESDPTWDEIKGLVSLEWSRRTVL